MQNTINEFMTKATHPEDYKFLCDYLDKNFVESPTLEAACEAAVYSKERKYPVFICLSNNPSWQAKIITKATRTHYSHSMLALNVELDPLYSFGRKKVEIDDIGFTVLNPHDSMFQYMKYSYSVFVMFLTKLENDKLKARLDFFIEHRDEIHYDFFALLLVWANLPSETSKKYFCSRFVADVISAGAPLPKRSSLYKPEDLSKLDNISLLDEGTDLAKYDVNKAKKVLDRIKKECRID